MMLFDERFRHSDFHHYLLYNKNLLQKTLQNRGCGDFLDGGNNAQIKTVHQLYFGAPSSIISWQVFYRLRPYCSWLDTQSEEEIAEASDISPARAVAATISANLLTLPLPKQPNSSRHSRCVASPTPPP